MKPRVFLPAIASGVLLWTAFFPLDFGPVAYVALVPWLTLVRSPTVGRRLYFAAYLGGFAFFLPALEWLHVAHPMMYFSWAGLALVCPLFWVAALFLLRHIDRLSIVPLALSVSVVWVALEYLRAHAPTGYPFMKHLGMYQMSGFGWYFLGYTQHEFTALRQIADLAGVYGVTFLVAALNGLACEWLLQCSRVRRFLRWDTETASCGSRCLAIPTVAVIALFSAAIGYGSMRLDHPAFADGPRVAALQGSVPQFEKNEKGDTLRKTYFRLFGEAFALQPRPDLIIWPETCYPGFWFCVAPGHEGEDIDSLFREDLHHSESEFINLPWQIYVLFGISTREWESGQKWMYNSALEVDPIGKVVGRYDKMHLVPFGEYVPFRETLPFLQLFSPYDKDYNCRPGEHWTRFPIRTAAGREYTYACLICYEDSDPGIARQYVESENPVDFLVNISNDGWFDGTEEHEEHLAICRFRAIETRRSIVRAVNMGISAVIDSDGRIVALPRESWSASKKIEEVVSAVMPIDNRTSWYAQHGDWLPAVCWTLIATALVAVVASHASPR